MKLEDFKLYLHILDQTSLRSAKVNVEDLRQLVAIVDAASAVVENKLLKQSLVSAILEHELTKLEALAEE